MTPPSPIGRRLRALIRRSSLNQRDAAKWLGLTAPHLNRILSGRLVDPGVATAATIHRRTGCDLQWLITGKSSQPAVPASIQRLDKIISKSTKRRAA